MRSTPALFALLFLSTQSCPALARSFVSIGSDDWGRWTNHGPIWPNSGTRELFHEQGLWLSGGVPPRITAETATDIQELLDFIESLNSVSSPRQQVTITPFWVVAGPDFEAMRDSGCPGKDCEYKELWWHNSSGGLAREPFERGDLRDQYRNGMKRGLWRPQYHGRSHFDARAWTSYLREEEEVTSIYFGHGLTYYHYGKWDDNDGMYHSTHSEYKSDHRTFQRGPEEMARWVGEGLESFRSFWGYNATVTAMPCHYGDDFLGGIFREHGISMVEGEEGGRGLLPGLPGMGRVMFDPGFETEERWEGLLQSVITDVQRRLKSGGMAAVQWHAQNSLGAGHDGVYSRAERVKLQALFRRLVEQIRTMDSGQTVVVTASELEQISRRGWSVEGWPGWVRLRNYAEQAVTIRTEEALVTMLHAGGESGADGRPLSSSNGDQVRMWCITEDEIQVQGRAVGRELTMEREREYVVLRLRDDAARLPDGVRRLIRRSQVATASKVHSSGPEDTTSMVGWTSSAVAVPNAEQHRKLEGRAAWLPSEVADKLEVHWETRQADANVWEVTVRVDGFEFLSAESGVRADIGYAALHVGHVRVATMFESKRTIRVDKRVSSSETERRGMRQGGGLAEVFARSDSALVSLALYHGDGTAMGLVSSIVVGGEDRRQPPQTMTVFGKQDGGSQLDANKAVEAEMRCLLDGAQCGSLCGWEGVVPVACSAQHADHRQQRSTPETDSDQDARSLVKSWDSAALSVSVVVLVNRQDNPAALQQTLRSLRKATSYPIQRVVVVDRSHSPLSATKVLDEFQGWSDLQVVHSPSQEASAMSSLSLAYARVDSPWVLVTTDEHDFTTHGTWLAEAIAVLRAHSKAASLSLLDVTAHPHSPLLRAGKTPSNHTFFPFAASWESSSAGLALLPALHRQESFELAQPLSAFATLDDLEAFLRLLGYSALSLVGHSARLRLG